MDGLMVDHYGETDVAVIADNRQILLDLLEKTREKYFEITVPCGCSLKFNKPEDIPLHDLKCQCGKNYLIKYKKRKREG